jgi:hypothetical protein
VSRASYFSAGRAAWNECKQGFVASVNIELEARAAACLADRFEEQAGQTQMAAHRNFLSSLFIGARIRLL